MGPDFRRGRAGRGERLHVDRKTPEANSRELPLQFLHPLIHIDQAESQFFDFFQ